MDIEKIRSDIQYYGDKLFLNSAGASLMPKAVTQAIHAYLEEEEKLGGYFVQEKKSEELSKVYTVLAKFLSTKERNIAITSSATDGYTSAISSVAFEKGDVIVTTALDYISNQAFLDVFSKKMGLQVIVIKMDSTGELDRAELLDVIAKNKVKLLSISHIPTSSGTIQDVEAIGEICQKYGIIYSVDACQSVGQMPIDVEAIKCDFLTATARKFLRGPRGTGFLYVSDKMLSQGVLPINLDGTSAIWSEANKFKFDETAKRFERWEKPYAMVEGLKEAVRYANNVGLDNIWTYNSLIRARLKEYLNSISGVHQYDFGSNTSNIITFLKEGKTLKEHIDHLQKYNVFFSVSYKKSAFLDLNNKAVEAVVRLSPHYFNTLEEMDRIASIVSDL